jgi:hypothetical protein
MREVIHQLGIEKVAILVLIFGQWYFDDTGAVWLGPVQLERDAVFQAVVDHA